MNLKLNCDKLSTFLIACREGHLDVVKLMLSQSWLMELETDSFHANPLSVAIFGHHKDIVREILKTRPNFARKINETGFSCLHHACSRGQFDIVKLLLIADTEAALQYNNYGHTPLHLAVINGYLPILKLFISEYPNSIRCLTKKGETIFHLAVKFNRYNLITCLEQLSELSDLLQLQDQDGNTVLHLSVSTGNSALVEYFLNKGVDIDCQNHEGQTVLNILQQTGINPRNKVIKQMIMAASPNRSTESSKVLEQAEMDAEDKVKLKADRANQRAELSSATLNLEIVNPEQVQSLENTKVDLEDKIRTLLQYRGKHVLRRKPNPKMDDNFEIANPIVSVATRTPGDDALNRVELRHSESSKLNQHKHKKRARRKEPVPIKRNRKYEMHREALQNAHNTIILVAVLIASVTFTVGINPPGGVNQGGIRKGQAAVSKNMAFRIFAISNTIALFTSLCIVIVLVSIIPFQRKKLMQLMVITHKVMWLAVSFMSIAFISGTWVILPSSYSARWMVQAISAISGTSMVTVCIYLGIQLRRHWLRKSKWKKKKCKKMRIVAANIDIESQLSKSVVDGMKTQPEEICKRTSVESESSNSDVDSAASTGYHTY